MADDKAPDKKPDNNPTAGTHTVKDGVATFTGATHPRREEVGKNITKAQQDLFQKALPETSAELAAESKKKWGRLLEALPAAEEKQAAEIIYTGLREGTLDYTRPDLNWKVLEKIEKQLGEGAEAEIKALNVARKDLAKVGREIHAVQMTALKEAKAEAQVITNFKRSGKTLDRLLAPTAFKTNYQTAIEEGLGVALKDNFSWNAMKKTPGKVALKGAGTLVGLGFVYDAGMHGQRMGPDGQMQDRSWVSRTGEAAFGGLVALGSALHGRRL